MEFTGSSFCDTGWQQSLGSGTGQGGHKVGEGSRKGEANILAPPRRELRPFLLLSQHNTGAGAGVGAVAGTAVREGRGGQESVALKLWRGEVWRSPSSPQVRQSVSQPHRASPSVRG